MRAGQGEYALDWISLVEPQAMSRCENHMCGLDRNKFEAISLLLGAARVGNIDLLTSGPVAVADDTVFQVTEHRTAAQLRDPSYEMVLEAAATGNAEMLVSVNHRDFGKVP